METIQGPHIELSKTENDLVQLLKQVCELLRKSRPDLPSCECRIAGGWVRDKVGVGRHSSCTINRNYLTYVQLLGSTTTDMDVSLSSLTGSTFATLFLEYLTSIGVISPCDSEPHIISANPAKSKALETARKNILGIELDFVQLRTESYNEDTRIPEIVCRIYIEWNLAHRLFTGLSELLYKTQCEEILPSIHCSTTSTIVVWKTTPV
jgi:tRNA nucleotidyltransferase (CCA-adding enzyme)